MIKILQLYSLCIWFCFNFQALTNTTSGIRDTPLNFSIIFFQERHVLSYLNKIVVSCYVGKFVVGEEYMQEIQVESCFWNPLQPLLVPLQVV
jgi:hypothetical protein